MAVATGQFLTAIGFAVVGLVQSTPGGITYVITGLANGQGVLYSKVHHAAVDGGAGMAINKALYDVTAVPREVAPNVWAMSMDTEASLREMR